MLHFTYEEEDKRDPAELRQGDILRRTPELEKLLKEYYSYFGNNDENQFFLVITQSCDLVPRDGGACKAKYIELAAVRPLRVAVKRELDHLAESGFDLRFTVAGMKRKGRFEQFLERLFNNNEHEYFYLCKEPTAGLPEDCCAFLHLTVPIKAMHYPTCLQARVLSLNTVFQAKLGWLVGQIYARVGTTDWPSADLRKMVGDITREAAVWVDDKLIKSALGGVQRWKHEHPGEIADEEILRKLVQELPRKKDVALGHIKRVLENSPLIARLTQDGKLSEGDLERLLKQLGSDQQFTNSIA